jgi:hypothetical protein
MMRHSKTPSGTPGAMCVLALSALVLAAPLVCWGGDVAGEPEEKVIRKGGVRYFVKAKRIEVDGKFCLKEGPLELIACAKGGKEYESIVSLDVNPEVLHFCMLLMGLKPGDTGPKFQGDPDNVPTGSPVIIEVRWKEDGKDRQVRIEDLCWNAIDRRPMARTPWVFVGSQMVKDQNTGKKVLWVKVEKSIVAVFRDPYALLDLPLALGANDEAYEVRKGAAPAVGTACTMIFTPAVMPAAPKNPQGGRVVMLDVTAGGRVLLNHTQLKDLAEALRSRHKAAPKDSFRVNVDHLAPAKALAACFTAIAESGVPVETAKAVHLQPKVTDVLTLIVGRGGVMVNGKPLTDKLARAAAEVAISRDRKTSGVAIKVITGAKPQMVARAAGAFKDIEDLPIRLIWAVVQK